MWDLHLSVMKPVVAHLIDDESVLSCMMFSEESPVILVGGSKGALYILRFVSTSQRECQEVQSNPALGNPGFDRPLAKLVCYKGSTCVLYRGGLISSLIDSPFTGPARILERMGDNMEV